MIEEGDKIYHAVMPEIFGYGLESFAASRAGAVHALKAEYMAWRDGGGVVVTSHTGTFHKACEFSGATVRAITLLPPMGGARDLIGEIDSIDEEDE